MNSAHTGISGRSSRTSGLSRRDGSFKSETARFQRKPEAFGHTVTPASASSASSSASAASAASTASAASQIIRPVGSHRGYPSKSIDKSGGVPLYGSQGNRANPEPHTTKMRRQLIPKQKQKLLDHVDKRDSPPKQKEQAIDDIEKADNWLKSVKDFFKNNTIRVLVSGVLVIGGIVSSIIVPVVLPIVGLLFLTSLVTFVFWDCGPES